MKSKTLSLATMIATLALFIPTAGAATPEPTEWKTGQDGCHVLLTVQECAAHRDALGSIASVSQRYAYLERHGIPLREREALCAYNRGTSTTVYHPMRALHVANR